MYSLAVFAGTLTVANMSNLLCGSCILFIPSNFILKTLNPEFETHNFRGGRTPGRPNSYGLIAAKLERGFVVLLNILRGSRP